jgi:two-component system sensor kinase FixL
VITALNDFARLPVPEMQPVNVESLLKDILEVTTLPRNITVQWSLGSPPPQVLGDRAQLHIVFSNLVRNARDAMPDGGTLALTATSADKEVDITVRDSGEGIATENLARIFEPLYSTKAKGIGLGLSIAHEILGRHHGTLTAKSELGAGSSFTVRLPCAS